MYHHNDIFRYVTRGNLTISHIVLSHGCIGKLITRVVTATGPGVHVFWVFFTANLYSSGAYLGLWGAPSEFANFTP